MSLQAMVWAWRQRPSDPMAKFVLVAWSDHTLDPRVAPPIPWLADETGLTSDQVIAAVDLLHLEGILPAPQELWDPSYGATPGPQDVNRRKVYPLLVERDGDHCQDCEAVDPGRMHIDHVMPRSRDGGNELENLQLLCRSCNQRKKGKHPDVWRAEVAARRAASRPAP